MPLPPSLSPKESNTSFFLSYLAIIIPQWLACPNAWAMTRTLIWTFNIFFYFLFLASITVSDTGLHNGPLPVTCFLAPSPITILTTPFSVLPPSSLFLMSSLLPPPYVLPPPFFFLHPPSCSLSPLPFLLSLHPPFSLLPPSSSYPRSSSFTLPPPSFLVLCRSRYFVTKGNIVQKKEKRVREREERKKNDTDDTSKGHWTRWKGAHTMHLIDTHAHSGHAFILKVSGIRMHAHAWFCILISCWWNWVIEAFAFLRGIRRRTRTKKGISS